jgi:Glyoxalase-like domain
VRLRSLLADPRCANRGKMQVARATVAAADVDSCETLPSRGRPRKDAMVRIEFTLDCTDLARMASFWREAAGLVVNLVVEDRYVALTGNDTTLTLQRVPEPKITKNRMHLDLLVDDLNQQVQRLESLGADSCRRGAPDRVRSDLVCARGPRGQRVLRRSRSADTQR